MSDATKCAKCNWVYWTSSHENWGICPKCGTNNDFYKGSGKPKLVGSEYIFTYYDSLLDKAEDVCTEQK